MTHLTICMSAARLIEAKSLLNRERFKEARDEIHPRMGVEGLEAHRKINKYFGKENMLHSLRNKVAFHFDLDVAERAMNGIHEDQEIADYHATTFGNAFYGSGAILTAFQIATIAGVHNGADHFDNLLDEVRTAAHWFEIYAAEYLICSAQHYMGADIHKMEEEKINVDVPSIIDVQLPYFMDDNGVTAGDFG